ncbi:MAG TPA: hypothetical protein VNH11_07160 [Pirellulales bacterium]|nr:hypothetical protein [Pirellulales bacterium]
MRAIVAVPLMIVTVAVLSAGARESAARREGQSPRRAAANATAADKDNGADAAAEVDTFMRLKLEHSQKLLEGVALADFGLIKKHAQKLGALSQDENWRVPQTREYRDYGTDFQQITGRLSKAADERNLDGAALAYVQLTLNCVDCHKHVRDEAK